MKTKIILLAAALALLCSCGWRTGTNNDGQTQTATVSGGGGPKAEAASDTRQFPKLSVPSVYGDDANASREYVLEHYWDGFFKGDWKTTPEAILGVPDAEVEQALSNYIEILLIMKSLSTPDEPHFYNKARESIKKLFSQLEAKQLADTSAKTYLRFTEKASSYLFDPNSPMRDEDYYLPFVEGMAVSPCTREDMRNAYRYEAKQCRTNGYGQTVPNFSFKDARGNKSSLYAYKVDYTMLFFSNPGCNSCQEIIDDISTCKYISPMIKDKRLAIVNIYIDEEVDKWRDYLSNYPSNWVNGYDYTFSLRDSGSFDIRAIPSLYLLDSRKRVLLKDAPTGRVLDYLEKHYDQ